MACRFLAPLTEEQIIAAVDNDIPAEVAAHLRDCQDCRARFEVEKTLERALMHGLFRIDCPTLDKLRDYTFDILARDIQETIEQHLQGCRHCRQEIASMKEFSDKSAAQLDVPTTNRPSQPRKWPFVPPNAILGRVTSAAQIRNVRGSGLFRGSELFRGSGLFKGVLLEATDVDITLDAEQNDDQTVTLSGQFLVTNLNLWNDALVELWQDGQLIRFTLVDETGAFECQAKSTTNIRLVIISRHEQVLTFNDINFPAKRDSS